MKAAGLTDVGVKRDANEDAFFCDGKGGILVVADGVGGQAGGETASAMAGQVFREGYRNPPSPPARDPREETDFLAFLVDKARFIPVVAEFFASEGL